MSHLSLEAKEAIIQQALSRGDRSIRMIAEKNNVGLSTLSKWLKRYRDGDLAANFESSRGAFSITTQAEKLSHLVATAALDNVSLGRYCREQGLYSHQLVQWREEFMNTPSNKKLSNPAELKQLKDENKRLLRELRRKEKALAEASALLIMKKKADLIWGESEVD